MVYLFPEPGHAAHQVGLNFLDRVLDNPGVVVEGYGDTPRDAEEIPCLLENMGHRQKCHGEVIVFDCGEQFDMFLDALVVVAVCDHHSFGFAGGAGGVDQCGHVFGESARRAGFNFGCSLSGGVHAEAHEVVPEDCDGIIVAEFETVVLEHHDAADRLRTLLPLVVGHGIVM